MNGMTLNTPSPVSLRYWGILKDLSDNVKLELVAMLSNAVVYKEKAEEPELTEEEKEKEFWSLCGCWKDDPDGAIMEAAIKDGRKNEFMREINLDD